MKRAKFGQVSLLTSWMRAGVPYPAEFDHYIETLNLGKSFEESRDMGVAVIPGYFSSDTCDELLGRLDLSDSLIKEADEYQGNDKIVEIDDFTFSLWLSMPLIAILGKYLGQLPYARNYPTVSIANPSFNILSTREVTSPHDVKLNIRWHFDTANLVKFAVLLNDVDENSSCIQVLSGAHIRNHINLNSTDYWLSDEYVRI